MEKRLKFNEHQRETIAAFIQSPPAGTEDHPKPWLQKCQNDINMLTAQLAAIMGDLLALPGEDMALLTEATVIQGAAAELDFEAGQWLLILKAPKGSEAHLEPIVELRLVLQLLTKKY